MKQFVMTAAVIALWAGVGRADHCPKPCGPTCAPCPAAPVCPAPAIEWREVERTILVPEWSTAKRKIHVTEYKHETHDKQITVSEMVKKEEQKTREVTVYERQNKSRVEQYWVDVPVWKDVVTKFNVQVAATERHKAKRTISEPVWREVEEKFMVNVARVETHKQKFCVWRSVPVKHTRTVCEDHGHWAAQAVQMAPAAVVAPCNGCPPCVVAPVCMQQVWVPKIVSRNVECVTYQCQAFEEERDVHVTVCKPEPHSRKVQVCDWVNKEVEYEFDACVWKTEERSCTQKVCEWKKEEHSRTINWVECVPSTKTEEFTVCSWTCVPTVKTVKETVCVAVTVEKEIDVPVCKMVEKTIKEKVCVQACAAPCEAPAAPACAPCRPACVTNSPCPSACAPVRACRVSCNACAMTGHD